MIRRSLQTYDRRACRRFAALSVLATIAAESDLLVLGVVEPGGSPPANATWRTGITNLWVEALHNNEF